MRPRRAQRAARDPARGNGARARAERGVRGQSPRLVSNVAKIMTRRVKCAFEAMIVLFFVTLPGVAQEPPDVISRARGAERVVVATVTHVEPIAVRNHFGDELIISRTTLAVEEVLQGQAVPSLTVDIEGGTIGELTLEVSDMPAVQQGDRGVFFVRRSVGSAHVLHRRGEGMLRLRLNDVVDRPGLTLDAIRRQFRAVAGRAPR